MYLYPAFSSPARRPDDDKFFAAAIDTRTKIIVSGDKHLLRESGYQGVSVVTPRQFVVRYLPE